MSNYDAGRNVSYIGASIYLLLSYMSRIQAMFKILISCKLLNCCHHFYLYTQYIHVLLVSLLLHQFYKLNSFFIHCRGRYFYLIICMRNFSMPFYSFFNKKKKPLKLVILYYFILRRDLFYYIYTYIYV